MNIEESLKAGRFVITSEIGSVGDQNDDDLYERGLRLRAWASGVRLSIVEGQQDGTWLPLCNRLRDAGFDLELDASIRPANRLQIEQTLVNASAAGIQRILIFSRDYCISGRSLHEMMYFHVDAEKFFSVYQSLERGVSLDGRHLPEPVHFLVGAGVDHQTRRSGSEDQVRELKRLVDYGVRYFVARPVFEVEAFSRFLDKVSPLGIPVIAEVLPLTSTVEALALNEMSWVDIPRRFLERLDKAESRLEDPFSLTEELIERLRRICAGIHIIPYGNDALLAPLLTSLTA
jgi:methylenetetrahydrofolate reductase (NADPH)